MGIKKMAIEGLRDIKMKFCTALFGGFGEYHDEVRDFNFHKGQRYTEYFKIKNLKFFS
jgi:hypothetical protein